MFKLILAFLIPISLIGCSQLTSNYQGKGTMKSWLQLQAQSEGLELRWNMNGDYDIPELHKQELKDFPLGQKVRFLQRNMTLNNITKKLEWPISHAGQQYPYPIMVVAAVCKKTLVFAEVEDIDTYNKNLIEGKYEGCIAVNENLGFKAPPTLPIINIPVSTNSNPLNTFAVPPISGASSSSQLYLPPGQFEIPVIGDPDQEVPKMEEIKK